MAFRDKERADEHRIDVLEDELAERAAEIERLRRELRAKDEPPKTKRKKKRKKQPPPARAGGTYSAALHGNMWMVGLMLLMMGGAFGGIALNDGQTMLGVFAALAGVPGLVLLVYRGGVEANGDAGSLVLWRRVFVRWSRTIPYSGKSVRVETYSVSSKNGPSRDMGRVYVGKEKLWSGSRGKTIEEARTLARVLGIPFAGAKHEGGKKTEKRAMMPLMITYGIAAVLFVVMKILGLV